MAGTGDWEVRWSSSRKRPYFYSASTQQSVWDPPPGLSEEQILALPGAQNLQAQTGQGLGGAMAQATPDGKVRASHLLIKHAGSRRPASWKEPNITRSKDEAISTLSAHRTHLASLPSDQLPAEFAKLASEHSDCSSHAHGGDLGPFGRGQMQKPFEDATYALEVGQMSEVVDTDSGVHLILRTA